MGKNSESKSVIVPTAVVSNENSANSTTSPTEEVNVPVETKEVPVVPTVALVAATGGALAKSSFFTKKRIVLGIIFVVVVYLAYKYKDKIMNYFRKKPSRSEELSSMKGVAGQKRRSKSASNADDDEDDNDNDDDYGNGGSWGDEDGGDDKGGSQACAKRQRTEDNEDNAEADEHNYLATMTETERDAIIETANALTGDSELLPEIGQMDSTENLQAHPFPHLQQSPIFQFSLEPMDLPTPPVSQIEEIIEEGQEDQDPNTPNALPPHSERFGKRSRSRRS